MQPKIRIKQNGWLAKNIVAEVIINFTSHLSFKDEGVKLVILDNNVIAACYAFCDQNVSTKRFNLKNQGITIQQQIENNNIYYCNDGQKRFGRKTAKKFLV